MTAAIDRSSFHLDRAPPPELPILPNRALTEMNVPSVKIESVTARYFCLIALLGVQQEARPFTDQPLQPAVEAAR